MRTLTCVLLLSLALPAQAALVNGDFSDGLSGWNVLSNGPIVSVVDGKLTVEAAGSDTIAFITQAVTIVGQRHWLTLDYEGSSNRVEIGVSANGGDSWNAHPEVFGETTAFGPGTMWVSLHPGSYDIEIAMYLDREGQALWTFDNAAIILPEPTGLLLALSAIAVAVPSIRKGRARFGWRSESRRRGSTASAPSLPACR